MFWMVMLRCDSRCRLWRSRGAGREDHQRAVIGCDFGGGALECSGSGAGRVLSGSLCGFDDVCQGTGAGNGFSGDCEEMLDAFAIFLHCVPGRAKIEGRSYAEAGKSTRLQRVEHTHNFAGCKPQIDRRNNDADLEAGILQQHVIDRQRQLRYQEVALAEAELQQFSCQRGGVPIEFDVGKCAAAIGAQHGNGIGLGICPFGHHAVQQVSIRIFVFVFSECIARHLHVVEKWSRRGIAFSWSPEARCCRL